jgi:iron complex outermembrane receptor protein
VLAQETTVTGTVTDAQAGETLPGVNVTIQGTQTGTVTNAQGQYELEVPGPDATLVFSFVGYQSETVQVGDQTVIDVSLQEDVGQLDQVVVTGYGTQQRRNVTGAQASVDVADAITGQTTSPQDLIQGRVAGVQIVSNSGEPGAGMRIRVRGQKSLSASNDPLYVIDGVPISTTNMTPGGAEGGGVSSSNDTNPLAMINPQDIESIEILKDAAATAIYGSQGSNGVVLIETKTGAGGGLQATYNGQFSAGAVSNTLDLLGAEEYRAAVTEYNRTPADEQPAASTDWQDEIFRSTFSQSHNLSFSGGTESTSFRASANYSNTEGALLDSGLERFSGRVNGSHNTLSDRLRLNLNLTASQTNRNHAFFNQAGGFEGGAIKSAAAFDPRRPVRQDGDFFEYLRSVRNPVGLLEQISDNTEQQRIIGSLSADLDLLENLTVDGRLSADWSNAIRRSYIPQANAVGAQVDGEASQNERSLTNLVGQSTITYDKDFFGGAHSFRFLGGFEFQRETFNQLGTRVQGFVTDATLYNNLGSGTNILAPFSNKEQVDQVGLFGRVNYNVQGTYLFEATVRRDGSSVFGRDNKFAYFPSASVGWNMAEEPFLDVEGLTQLKLRVSAGISGNQGVPPYESLPLLTPSAGNAGIFGDGEEEVIGVTQVRAASPGLKWEETRELNVGVDFTAGRFDGTVNYYRQYTDDLLLDVRVQQPAPSETVLDNVGAVSNQGVEASLEAFVLNREDLSLNVGVNASSNRNLVEDLGDRGTIDHGEVSGQGLTDVQAQRLAPGHPIGSFYGPVFVGVDDSGQEVYETADGGTTTDESQAEDQFIGNVVPDVSYGFNLRLQYHGFDASAFLRGEYGRDLFNNTAAELTTKSLIGRLNVLEETVTDGTSTTHSPTYSSRWVEDASFLRMDKLTVGYSVPDVTRYNLRNLRFYVSAQNLFVITPYSGYDPELNTNVSGEGLGFRTLATPSRGIDYTSYPRQRTFTFGIELGL